ncbi:MAG: hypothetical protein FJ087_15425 [Deltaproteobacteria bacterium]|nr:hypothetical protein [Deltaproteobacteria bacterium]
MARLARTAPGIPEASRETLAALIEGCSLGEIADARGVSAECVRKQAERGAAVLSRLVGVSADPPREVGD